MKYAMVLPGGTSTEQLEEAQIAEDSGWDGIFVWEAAYGVDAWALLAGMAVRTQRIRLGTLLTPIPWRRPWKLASQVATVDQLSGGRAILTVGVGAPAGDLPDTGEDTDLRRRAALMDEGIDLARALWRGETSFDGEHYHYRAGSPDSLSDAVKPVQDPIPIWVVGAWPRPKSMRRVLRCEGIVPQYPGHDDDRAPTPADAAEVRAFLDEKGASHIDLIAEGETPAEDPAAARATAAEWAEAGATWWIENRWGLPRDDPGSFRHVRERLAAGPPR